MQEDSGEKYHKKKRVGVVGMGNEESGVGRGEMREEGEEKNTGRISP